MDVALVDGTPQHAKTDRTGFLHLPDEVKNRVYKEALFDHDREAVYLPRKLPRKILPDGEKIYKEIIEDGDFPQLLEQCMTKFDAWDICHWEIGLTPPEEIPLPVYTEFETDDESESSDGTSEVVSEELLSSSSSSEGDVFPPNADIKNLSNSEHQMQAYLQTRHFVAELSDGWNDVDRCEYCGRVQCVCFDDDFEEAEEEVADAFDGSESEGTDSDDSFIVDGPNPLDEVSDDEDPMEDDNEHYDSEREIWFALLQQRARASACLQGDSTAVFAALLQLERFLMALHVARSRSIIPAIH